MKKVLCLLMVLSTFLICMNAYADDCEHLYKVFIEDDTYDRGHYEIGPAKHVWRYYYWQKCDYCGDRRLMCFEDEAEPHIFIYSSDWHVDGETVHYYEDVCRKCGYIRQYSLTCSDESCPKYDAMLRLIVDAEEQ